MQEEIKRVYEQWKNALIKADIKTLDKLYTDNFSWTNNMGITCKKEENLFRIGSGDVHYISWIDEDVRIDVMNDNAIVKAREVLKMLVYEQSIQTVRNVIVSFKHHNGEWLVSKIEERKNVA